MIVDKITGALAARYEAIRAPRPDTRLSFFRMWLDQPAVIAAPVPSGASLARSMASQVETDSNGMIIELGGGTGAITAALLDRGIDPGRIVVIESNVDLHRLLTSRFPLVRSLVGDAFRLRRLLQTHGLWAKHAACAVVCGLPMITTSRALKHRLLRDCFELLDRNGAFIQFTYGPSSPVGPAVLRAQQLKARRSRFVWNNVPPASVWRIER